MRPALLVLSGHNLPLVNQDPTEHERNHKWQDHRDHCPTCANKNLVGMFDRLNV